MRNQPVRMGQPSGNGLPKWLWAVVSLVLVGGIAAFFLLRGSDEEKKRFAGCNADAECTNGRICAGGGCIILLSDENIDMWHKDLDALLSTAPDAPAWSPRPTYGLKLNPVEDCGDIPSTDTKIEEQGVVSILKKANIYYASPSDFQLFQQVEASSNMWMNYVPLRLPKFMSTPPLVYCHGTEVSGFRNTPSEIVDGQLDVALTQSVPVGSVAKAALLIKRPLPQPGTDGSVTLDFELAPVLLGASEEVTALILPIGTDIISIRGALPGKQRLLTDHIAYYWKHSGRRQAITAIVKLPTGQEPLLRWEEIQP